MAGTELQGHLDGMLLAVLEAGPRHGYAIVEELSRRSQGEFDVPEGTIYPALHRLEAAGLLSSRWEGVSGRGRRRGPGARRQLAGVSQRRRCRVRAGDLPGAAVSPIATYLAELRLLLHR